MPPWRASWSLRASSSAPGSAPEWGPSSELRSRSRSWGFSWVSRSGSALSTHALKTSDTPAAVRLLRNVDLIVLALALVLFIAAGFPIAGWFTGAGAWIAHRLLGHLAV